MRYLLYIMLSLICFESLIAKSSEKQTIKLFGIVYYKEVPIKDVKVNIYKNDSLILTEETTNNGKFKFKLKEGYSYKIEFSKEKYITKTIIVNAFTNEIEAKVEAFAFDLDLIKERDFRYVNVPEDIGQVAHIYFNENSNQLEWDRVFTEEAHNEIKNFQELNKAKRHEKYSRF